MKRSRAVSLVLLGAAGATAYGLASWTGASSDQVAAEFYTGGSDCAAAGGDAAFCRAAFTTAAARHAADAPRFEARADCERTFGASGCTETRLPGPGGAVLGYWLPVMAGYAVARSLTGPDGAPVAQPLYACPPERQRPDGTCYTTSGGHSVYSSSSGGSWSGATSSGSNTSRSSTLAREARVPAAAFDRPAQGTAVVPRGGSIGAVTRGGFGATGRAVSVSHSSAS